MLRDLIRAGGNWIRMAAAALAFGCGSSDKAAEYVQHQQRTTDRYGDTTVHRGDEEIPVHVESAAYGSHSCTDLESDACHLPEGDLYRCFIEGTLDY